MQPRAGNRTSRRRHLSQCLASLPPSWSSQCWFRYLARLLLFHNTPLVDDSPTTYSTKCPQGHEADGPGERSFVTRH
jgi:hypothetical protein